jgi:iron complex transport system permease protein
VPGGALLRVIADLLARTVVAPVDLSLGAVLGLVGALFFFYPVERTRRAQGA